LNLVHYSTIIVSPPLAQIQAEQYDVEWKETKTQRNFPKVNGSLAHNAVK